MSFFKTPKVKDSKYSRWLAERYPCAVCGGEGGPPHHLPQKNMTRRADDTMQVSVCFNCHRYLHDQPDGEREMLNKLYQIAEQCWGDYELFKIQKRKGTRTKQTA